jgi:hypothetical protein
VRTSRFQPMFYVLSPSGPSTTRSSATKTFKAALRSSGASWLGVGRGIGGLLRSGQGCVDAWGGPLRCFLLYRTRRPLAPAVPRTTASRSLLSVDAYLRVGLTLGSPNSVYGLLKASHSCGGRQGGVALLVPIPRSPALWVSFEMDVAARGLGGPNEVGV